MNADPHDVHHQVNNENGDNVGASNDDDDDDEDLQEEDLDIFLVNLEARLRADFTSFDLSSVISSQGSISSSSSSASSTPARFLRLMHKVFHRAAKSIKLRALISVMGLDNDDSIGNTDNGADGGMKRNNNNYINSSTASNSNDDDDDDGRKTDAIVWKLLSHAMKKDDEIWVRVIAEIIRNIMFQRKRTKPTHDKNSKTKSGSDDGDATNANNAEGLESESKLHKVSEKILRGVEEACLRAQKRYDSAVKQGMQQLQQQQQDNQELMEQQEHQQSLATLLIGADIDPFYVPLRYHLLPSKVLRAILPEFEPSTAILHQQHFTPNMKSEILNMDDSYIEEERTVVAPAVANARPQQPQKGGVTAGGLTQVPDRISGVIDRGRFANSGQARGTTGSTSSSLFRPSVNTSIAVGRGGASTGRGRLGGVGRGMGGRMAAGVGRGAGGGGGRSLASLVAGGMGRGRIAGRGAVVNATTAARGRGGMAVAAAAAAGSGTKMKMIDVAEIEGLAQAAQVKNDVSGLSAVELRKLERKRKLLEDAAASGLKKSR